MRLCGAVRELIEKSIESDGEMDGLKSIFSRIGLYVFFFLIVQQCSVTAHTTYPCTVYTVHSTHILRTLCVCVCVDTHSQKKNIHTKIRTRTPILCCML